jgi:hypothetical protein
MLFGVRVKIPTLIATLLALHCAPIAVLTDVHDCPMREIPTKSCLKDILSDDRLDGATNSAGGFL